MPFVGTQRVQWIDAISKHQEFDFLTSNFSVCRNHFAENSFEKDNVLKVHSVPSIFDNSLNQFTENSTRNSELLLMISNDFDDNCSKWV